MVLLEEKDKESLDSRDDLIKSVRIRVILEIDILYEYKGFNGKLESNRRNE